ncbi:MAG: alpha/beta fold hydrolase, partial [Candidatus Binatia bacterium]
MSTIEERKFIALNISGEQINTCYHEAGRDNKESVIFAQTGGAGASAYMCWYLNMSAFADAGYHVYAPDFLGYGLTKRVSEEGGRIGTSEFILAFMDAFG